MKKSIKQQILSIIEDSKASVKPETLIEKLNIQNKIIFKSAILELQNEGKILQEKKGRIISTRRSGRASAKITSMSKFFAFAQTEDGDDIFIASRDLKTAIIGDTVLLHKIYKSNKGLSGVVERILKHGDRLITGKIIKSADGYEIISDNALRYNVPVAGKGTLGALSGDKVQALLCTSPKRKTLYAEVKKIYGKSDSAKVCSNAIIDANGLPYEFNPDTISEAKKVKGEITKQEIKLREDFRDEIIFTIDGEDAKDLDDAISIKKVNSGWELGVHIADVSHYVKLNSALEQEAFLRGTSVYFADRVIPMLPEEISNGVCSLNAGTDKLTFSAIVSLDKNGNLISYRFCKSIINSKVRGVYSEINQILGGEHSERLFKKYGAVLESIFLAKELSDILSVKSNKRGIVDIYSGESRFCLDENGMCVNVFPRRQGVSENIIENFMITANQAAGLYAKSSSIPFLYRVHEPPEPEKVRVLARLSSVLGLKSYRIRTGLIPADLSNLLNQAKNTPAYRIISRQVLRTMSKARYDPRPIGHFGLALEDYCHFTSPIRRYPDLCIHRILGELISGKNIDDIDNKYSEFAQDSCKQSSTCELRAMKAEREAEKCYMAEFMSQHIGEEYKGIISGAVQKGVFVELENSVSGFLDINYFPECRFMFDGLTCHIDSISRKKLSVGDSICVKVVSTNISSGTIDFAPVKEFSEKESPNL